MQPAGPAQATSGKSFVRDGFANLSAKLGAQNADNLLSQGGYNLDSRIITRNRTSLDGMYRGSWIIGKIVDAVPEDMTRAGAELHCDLPPEVLDELKTEIHRRKIWRDLGNAIRWGRLYGGAIAVIVIDGQDPSTPLVMDTIGPKSFLGLRVFDRWTCVPSLELIQTLGPDEGQPVSYMANEGAWNGKSIHHSRVIRFVGFPLPYYERVAELNWGASVVERFYDRLLAFDSTSAGAANLIFKAHLRTVGINGLRQILSQGGAAEDNLVKMFGYIRQMQSNEGITLLDKEDTFGVQSYSFAGLSDILLSFGQQISGASGIPLVRLFGQAPQGMNSTGESDLRTYYDTVSAAQEEDLRPGLERVYQVLCRSLTGDPLPEGWSIKFNPLWQLDNTAKATIASQDAQTMAGLHQAGILTQAQALKELRQSSEITGRFSNITDEDIQAVETAATAPSLESLEASAAPGEAPATTQAGGETLQEVSLNGAQVSSMMQIVSKVAAGQLPRESGIEMLATSFPISMAQAAAIMGSAGAGFVTASPEATQGAS